MKKSLFFGAIVCMGASYASHITLQLSPTKNSSQQISLVANEAMSVKDYRNNCSNNKWVSHADICFGALAHGMVYARESIEKTYGIEKFGHWYLNSGVANASNQDIYQAVDQYLETQQVDESPFYRNMPDALLATWPIDIS